MNEKTRINNKIRGKKWYAKNRDKFIEYSKQWYQNNKTHVLVLAKINRQKPHIKARKKQWDKEYAQKNSERIKAYKKQYYSDPINKLKAREYQREYRKKNKEKLNKKVNEYKKKRFKTDLSFKLHHYISTQIKKAIKNKPIAKKWSEILGYDCVELRKHLEKQFKRGMNWNNYGGVWHIDHRIPISWFKHLNDIHKLKTMWDLQNLQPMFANKNLKKSNRFAEPTLKQLKVIV